MSEKKYISIIQSNRINIFDLNQKGFSLIELLIGITITGVIFLGISLLTMSTFESNARIKQIDELEQTKHDLANEITNAIRWAEKIEFENNQLIIRNPDETYNTYSFSNNRIYKNNNPMTSQNVVVKNFSVKNMGGNLPLIEISLDISDAKFPTVENTIRFVASQRITTMKKEKMNNI